MKLWDFQLAYNPGKARLVLNEKGLPFETQHVNLLNGDSLKPDFLRVNAAGTLPVLEDEGKTIKESKEIVEYVDAKGGQTIGGADVDRQLVNEWVNKIDAWDGNLFVAGALKGAPAKIMGSIGDFRLKYAEARLKENPDLKDVYEAKIKALKATAAKGQDADAIRQNKEQLVAILDDAEAQLSKTAFLAGPAYSIADVMLTAVLNRITSIGGPAGEAKYITPRAKVSEYFGTVKARPSYAKTYSNSPAPVLGALAKATLSRVTGWY